MIWISAICCTTIILLALVYMIAFMPVRNYDYYHQDPIGDAEVILENPLNQNADIISVRSESAGDTILLEMRVVGSIDNNFTHRYHLIMVMRDTSHDTDEGYIYDFVYSDGREEHYDCEFSVTNNTLSIFVPKDMFLDSEYMVGLEGYAWGSSAYDFCPEGNTERSNTITYGLLGLTTGTAILAALAVAGKYKLYSAYYILSTRLKHETIPDQFVRGQIYGLIRAKPGIHYTGIRKTLKVGNGTLAYHLAVLEREGFVKSKRPHYNKQFYPTELPLHMNGLADRYPKGTEGIMYSEVHQRIIDIIRERPGITQSEIVEELALPKQTVSYNIGKLVEYGAVRVVNDGNRNRCYLDRDMPQS